MSEPWIRVYLADMRGDPKVYRMNSDMRWALLNAWDIAKNGPGDVCELRASDGRAMAERELRHLSSVSASATRRMFERWASVGLCELRSDGDALLVVFPKLASRQGIDRTHAERQRRYRQRWRDGKSDGVRDAKVTASRDGSVTGENQNQIEVTREDSTSLLSQPLAPVAKLRPRDEVWDTLVDVCGYRPEADSERGAWNKARKELRRLEAGADDVRDRAAAYRKRWPLVALTPTALVRHWGELAPVVRRRMTAEEMEAKAKEYGWP